MNTFGNIFRVSTWGESHGKALGALIDGCPPNLTLNKEFIQSELDRRKPGPWKLGSSDRHEADKFEILSGVLDGITLGTPISLIIWNEEQKSEDYLALKDVHRPGHADASYEAKFGIRDWRGGGRASGRETAARVMAGAIAKQLMPEIEFHSYIKQIGTVQSDVLNKKLTQEMESEIQKAKDDGDSVGGVIELHVRNLKAGIGSPVFSKLEAEIARAVLSIGAVKGIEFGEGFNAAKLRGSEHNAKSTGGMAGGISDGSDIIIRVAIKPPSSIAKEIPGRHDSCIVTRMPVVIESMVALVLIDQILLQKVNV